MKTIPFPEANTLIVPPAGSKNLIPMPVYTNGHSCVSVWQLTDDEIKVLAETRKLYVIVGKPPLEHPAVGVSVDNFIPDFNKHIILP